MSQEEDQSPFGDVIYSYTRAQAIADGFQVDVSQSAREAGIRFPVFLTRTVFDAYVKVPEGIEGQDEAGRLWDILTMVRFAIHKAAPDQTRLTFNLFVRNQPRRRELVQLAAFCGPLDSDKPAPAITVMMIGED
jgi:hypothetical protein